MGLTMTEETSFQNDERFWDAFDDVMRDSWPALKEFLDQAFEYKDEINPTFNALLFGVFGKFAMTYKQAKEDLNNPQQALHLALEAVQEDRRVQKLSENSINQKIDKKVEGLF